MASLEEKGARHRWMNGMETGVSQHDYRLEKHRVDRRFENMNGGRSQCDGRVILEIAVSLEVTHD